MLLFYFYFQAILSDNWELTEGSNKLSKLRKSYKGTCSQLDFLFIVLFGIRTPKVLFAVFYDDENPSDVPVLESLVLPANTPSH